jgi:hypothetical protein
MINEIEMSIPFIVATVVLCINCLIFLIKLVTENLLELEPDFTKDLLSVTIDGISKLIKDTKKVDSDFTEIREKRKIKKRQAQEKKRQEQDRIKSRTEILDL